MTRLALPLALFASPAFAEVAASGMSQMVHATIIWVVVLGLLGGVLAVMGRG